jgi:hypothetical protein
MPETSRLTRLNLASLNRARNSNLDVATLLRPLAEESTFEHLVLGSIDSEERVHELLSNIPRLRGLKERTFDVRQDYYYYENKKQLAIVAFKQNCSFEKVSNYPFP